MPPEKSPNPPRSLFGPGRLGGTEIPPGLVVGGAREGAASPANTPPPNPGGPTREDSTPVEPTDRPETEPEASIKTTREPGETPPQDNPTTPRRGRPPRKTTTPNPSESTAGARTSIKLDPANFEFVDGSRTRIRTKSGRAIDRGRFVNAILRGIKDSGADLTQFGIDDEAIARFVRDRMRS